MIVSIVNFSNVNDRLDSEFYHPDKLAVLKKLSKFDSKIGDDFISYKNIEVPDGPDIVNLVDLENVMDFSIDNVKVVKKFEAGSSKKHFAKNDILISKLRSYLKQIVYVDNSAFENEKNNLCSPEFLVLRQKKDSKIPPEFLFLYLQTDEIQTILAWSQEGSNHPRFSEKYLLSLPIVDNTKINSEILDLLKQFIVKKNEGEYLLKKANDVLENVLSINVSDFTSYKGYKLDFSKIENRLDTEYYQPKYQGLFKILSKYAAVPIKNFRTFNKRGVQPDYIEYSDYKALTSRYILKTGIAYQKLPSILESQFFDNEHIKLRRNDIVTYTTGAYVGRTQVWLKDNFPAIASNHVNILRAKNINPVYLGFVMNSFVGQMQIQRLVTGAAQAELYPKDIDNIVIPVLPESVQNEISDLYLKSQKFGEDSKNILIKANTKISGLLN